MNRLRAGSFAPDFILKDSEGCKLSLSDFSGKKNLLIFFCQTLKDPVCVKTSGELNRSYDQIRRRNTEVLLLSRNERWISRQMKQEKEIYFPILKIEGDPRYPSSAPPVSESERAALCPAVFIVDKGRTIRFRRVLVQPDHKLRPEELLCELDKLG